jgi:hypothetical protein
MSNNDNWIRARISEARAIYQLVTQSVSDRMDELLNGQLSKRPLSKAELTSIAKELIEGMGPVSAKTEGKP